MVPKLTGIAGLFLATFAGGPDAQSLVARLGAPKYADRQAAAAELEKLGSAAFPALRAGRVDQDLEVRKRAESLLDAIERASVGKPAEIQFEARHYSSAEIAEKLSEAQGMSVTVGDSRSAAAKNGITFGEPATLGAWELLDRLGLTFEAVREADYSGHGPMVRLTSGPLVRARTSDHGPFRFVVRTPFFAVDTTLEERRFRGSARTAIHDADLVIPIDVTSEPRLAVRMAPGVPIRVSEATDNRGRSLATTARGQVESTNDLFSDRAVTTLPLRVRLQPDGAAIDAIKRLKGMVTLEVEARKLEPIVIPIPGPGQAERRPFSCGGTLVQVNGMTSSTIGPRALPVIDMNIRNSDGGLPGGVGVGRPRNRGMWGRQSLNIDGDPFWENLEVVDSQGRPFRKVTAMSFNGNGDGRVELSVAPRDDDEQPAEIRFHTTIRAIREVPFDFKNIVVR